MVIFTFSVQGDESTLAANASDPLLHCRFVTLLFCFSKSYLHIVSPDLYITMPVSLLWKNHEWHLLYSAYLRQIFRFFWQALLMFGRRRFMFVDVDQFAIVWLNNTVWHLEWNYIKLISKSLCPRDQHWEPHPQAIFNRILPMGTFRHLKRKHFLRQQSTFLIARCVIK